MAYVMNPESTQAFRPASDPVQPQMLSLWRDVVGLGRDYVKLFQLRADHRAHVAKQVFACFLVACAFTPIGLAGLVFGGLGLAIADLPGCKSAQVCWALSSTS